MSIFIWIVDLSLGDKPIETKLTRLYFWRDKPEMAWNVLSMYVIRSFIMKIYVVPLKDYYSEALNTHYDVIVCAAFLW